MADLITLPGADGDPLTALLLRAAADPTFDVQKFESVIRFLGEREAKANERAFNAAMSLAQSELRAVFRDRSNTHLNTRYATLDAMLAVVLPAVNAHGLSIRFESEPHSDPSYMRVFIVISHADGHVSRRSMDGPVTTLGSQGGRTQMTPMQATGSAATYLSRYLLRMAFAIQVTDEPEDDDGEAQRQPAQQQRPAAQRQPQPEPEPKKKTSIREWLETLSASLGAATSKEASDAILAREDVQAASKALTGDSLTLFNGLVTRSMARWPTPKPAVPDSPITTSLLAQIADMTLTGLDALPASPSFNEKMMSIPLAEQERVDAAIKARAAALEQVAET